MIYLQREQESASPSDLQEQNSWAMKSSVVFTDIQSQLL